MSSTKIACRTHEQNEAHTREPVHPPFEELPRHYLSHPQVMHTVERLRAGERLTLNQDNRDAFVILIGFALFTSMVALIVPQLFFFWILPVWGLFLLYTLLPKSTGQLALTPTGITFTNAHNQHQSLQWSELKSTCLIKAGRSNSMFQFTGNVQKVDVISANYTGYPPEILLSIFWVMAHSESNLN